MYMTWSSSGTVNTWGESKYTGNSVRQYERGQEQRLMELSGEAWWNGMMEMTLIPLGRSRSVWRPFCKVWRLSLLPEPAASVTAEAESWNRKQPKSEFDKEATASEWWKAFTTPFIIYPDSCKNKLLLTAIVCPSYSTRQAREAQNKKKVWDMKCCRNCGRNAPRRY